MVEIVPFGCQPEGALDASCTHLRIDYRRCTRCGLCVAVCACGTLTLDDGDLLVAHPERCDACGACEQICPEGAIDCAFEIVWGEGQEPAATASARHPWQAPGEVAMSPKAENDGGDRA